MPELVVSRMTKSVRRGRVFVDWSQNDRAQDDGLRLLRARARAPDGVDAGRLGRGAAPRASRRRRRALAFDTAAVLERVARDGDLFAPVLSLVQELPRAV